MDQNNQHQDTTMND